MSEFQKDSLSLEETNKVRISLGLPPLQPDSEDASGKDSSKGDKDAIDDDNDDPLKNQDEKAAKNYAKYQDDLQRKREEEEIRERIARAQNKRELSRKLRGPTLGDAEPSTSTSAESSQDTLKWLKAARKKAKENAAKRLREETEAEELAAANAAKYDSEDLAGMKVGHDMDEIDLEAGGEGRVLTLKDSRILEGEDDELMDSAIEAAEKDRINAERKKGVKKYTGLDEDDEYIPGQIGKKKGVLSKYDNDIEGGALRKEDGGFTLGGQSMSRAEKDEVKRKQSEQILNRTLLDLDYTKNVEVSDYLQEGDIGFKKPKNKKKRRATARVRLDEEEEAEAGPSRLNGDTEMNDSVVTDSAGPSRRQALPTDNLIDDDDLSLSLSKARREKARKTFKKMTPEMIAKNLAEQRQAEEAERVAALDGTSLMMNDIDTQHMAKQEEGLVFDDTSEFVRNINEARQISPETEAKQQRRAAAAETARRQREEDEKAKARVKEEAPSPQPLDENGVDAEMLLDAMPRVKEEGEEESDEEMMLNGDTDEAVAAGDADGNAAEPLVSGGMAAALSLLRQQGLITGITAEQQEKERKQKEYDAWLATRRFEDRVREAELAASKAQGSAKDQATREYENRMRELEDAKRAQEKFKNYTPNIEIKYNDEFGRELNYHESWKRLSHIFHGKMPGQKKQEQRLQRIMDEKKREKMLAGDTPSGMSKAFADRAERSGQAHMVLGVGSKNNAPQDISLLGPNTLSRPPKEKTLKGKEKETTRISEFVTNGTTSATPSIAMNGMDSSITGITSMIPRSTTTRTKAGFAPVRNTAAMTTNAITTNGYHSPPAEIAQPSKFKLAFGKRPATEQLNAASAPHLKQLKLEDVEE